MRTSFGIGPSGIGAILVTSIAAAILAFAIGLRLWGLLAEPLWLDEAYSAFAADNGFAFLWNTVPRYETHPPFYYSVLRGWTLVWGDGLAGLRSLGAVCGIATLAVVALAADEVARTTRRERGERVLLVLVALALAGVSPILVEMTREVRPYPVMVLVYAGAIAALLRIGRRAGEGGGLDRAAFAAYLVCLALMLWLHNLGVLFGISLALALALIITGRIGRRDWLWLIAGHLLVALVWLPALMILIDQAPTWIATTWLKFSVDALPRQLFRLYALPQMLVKITLILLAIGGLALLLRERQGRMAAALATLALLPVALAVAISMTLSPVFLIRVLCPVVVPAALLLACGASWGGFLRPMALSMAALLAFALASADLGSRAGPPMENWYGAARFVASRMGAGDEVWAYPNESALPFGYAVRDLKIARAARPIPAAVPAIGWPGGWYPTGSRGVVSIPRDQLRSIAAQGAAIPTIWLLRSGAGTYDKGDVFLDELRRERVPVVRWRSGPIDIIGLRRASLAPVASPE